MNIVIREPSTQHWTSSPRSLTPVMRESYTHYKEREHYFRETPYNNGEYIVYRIDNNPYMPTYIAVISDIVSIVMRDDIPVLTNDGILVITQDIHDTLERSNMTIPILDLDDIRVFTNDVRNGNRANWVQARSYQIWAFRDFLYDRNHHIKKSYKSRGTYPMLYEDDPRILTNQIVTMDIANIEPNIIFNMIRLQNGTGCVCIQRNDATGTEMRICDNGYARAGYLGFYTRITMDPGIVVIPPPVSAPAVDSNVTSLLSIAHLSALEETNDPDVQCILCVHYRVNARFSPCEHQVCCSSCYSHLAKNECPVCRAEITRIMNV